MNTVAWIGPVARHPRLVLASVVVATLIALLLCFDPVSRNVRFQIDPSAEALLPVDDPGRAVLDEVRKTFGVDDPLIIAVRFEPSVYTEENLARTARLAARFKQLPEVSEVLSLATAPNLLARDDEIDVTSFTDQAARDPTAIHGFAAQISANPLYRSALVSDDGSTAAFALSTGAALTPQAIVDGMRSGNAYYVNGDLIDRLAFVACRATGSNDRINHSPCCCSCANSDCE